MSESPFEALERKVDDLIRLCAELNSENAALKADADSWVLERQQLVEKNEQVTRQNEQARSKVQAMISRLKAMEQEA
jgi:cell division protein ZapB